MHVDLEGFKWELLAIKREVAGCIGERFNSIGSHFEVVLLHSGLQSVRLREVACHEKPYHVEPKLGATLCSIDSSKHLGSGGLIDFI